MKCPNCNGNNVKYIMEGTIRVVSEDPDYPDLSELCYGSIHDVIDSFENYKLVECICYDCDHEWSAENV